MNKYKRLPLIDREEEELVDLNKKTEKINDTVFDYSSITNFQSAFSYSKQLNKENHLYASVEKRSLAGLEKFIHYFVVMICVLLMLALLPFSLIFAIKHIRSGEKLVVYRLGRVQHRPRNSGWTIVLPFIDCIKRISTKTNQLIISPIQILCRDDSILEIGVCIEYIINDPILVLNSLHDLNHSLRSLSRSTLITFTSQNNGTKIEQNIHMIELSMKNEINQTARNWGIEILKVNIARATIISTGEENPHKSFHPALDAFSKIFAGIIQQSSTMDANNPTPVTVPGSVNTSKPDTISVSSILSLLLVRLRHVFNEELVRQVGATYQFNIGDMAKFYIDLKNGNGSCDLGDLPARVVDVTITLNSVDDLKLLTGDTDEIIQAYLSQQITIDGSLTDAMKLKHLADVLKKDNITLLNSVKNSHD